MVFTDAKEANHPLIFANDSFLSLSGYDRKEVLGQSFDFLMGRPVDPRALAQVEAAFAGSSENEFEFRFRREDGRTAGSRHRPSTPALRSSSPYSASRRPIF
jgi:PAS domain S-box-containing protein